MTNQRQGSPAAEPPPPPALRIVDPHATPEEIAVIVAVLAALSGSPAPSRRQRPAWADPARGVRRPLSQGPGGWRASGLPH